MGQDYSYTQLSESGAYGGEAVDSAYSETEDLIRRDQAEIEYNYGAVHSTPPPLYYTPEPLQYTPPPLQYTPPPVQYPSQPEVEFGFLEICYCGRQPVVATSKTRNDTGRLYYTCDNVNDGECHVWKWWDVAVMEEMRARDRHTLQLAQKVDS